jgi:beta-aspartyl-peptidase (threonine type)
MLRLEVRHGLENQYHAALKEALLSGFNCLDSGKSSIDAVEAAIRVLEDTPLYNAGRGAVIANSGRCELDASIMDGRTKKAGAVASLTIAKNPISVARAVMERTDYVMLAGLGADQFANDQKLDIVDQAYFITENQSRLLEALQQEEAAEAKFGTVGAVALDQAGNLAAGTSTGGMRNKQYNRIGDSPIIGAGTFADNETCAVSCTGEGEVFMRYVVAYDLAAMIQYKGSSLEEAAKEVISNKLTGYAGRGGLIALDRQGDFAMPYNTEGMFRGFITTTGECETYIYDA